MVSAIVCSVALSGGTGTTCVWPNSSVTSTLQTIAETTGGKTYEAPTEEQLRSVYEEVATRVGYDERHRELTVAFTAAGGVLLLLGAALSALWFNRIP